MVKIILFIKWNEGYTESRASKTNRGPLHNFLVLVKGIRGKLLRSSRKLASPVWGCGVPVGATHEDSPCQAFCSYPGPRHRPDFVLHLSQGSRETRERGLCPW